MFVNYTIQGEPRKFEICEEQELDQAIGQITSTIRENLQQKGLGEAMEGSLEEHVANAILMNEGVEELNLGEIQAVECGPPVPAADANGGCGLPLREAHNDPS